MFVLFLFNKTAATNKWRDVPVFSYLALNKNAEISNIPNCLSRKLDILNAGPKFRSRGYTMTGKLRLDRREVSISFEEKA